MVLYIVARIAASRRNQPSHLSAADSDSDSWFVKRTKPESHDQLHLRPAPSSTRTSYRTTGPPSKQPTNCCHIPTAGNLIPVRATWRRRAGAGLTRPGRAGNRSSKPSALCSRSMLQIYAPDSLQQWAPPSGRMSVPMLAATRAAETLTESRARWA